MQEKKKKKDRLFLTAKAANDSPLPSLYFHASGSGSRSASTGPARGKAPYGDGTEQPVSSPLCKKHRLRGADLSPCERRQALSYRKQTPSRATQFAFNHGKHQREKSFSELAGAQHPHEELFRTDTAHSYREPPLWPAARAEGSRLLSPAVSGDLLPSGTGSPL